MIGILALFLATYPPDPGHGGPYIYCFRVPVAERRYCYGIVPTIPGQDDARLSEWARRGCEDAREEHADESPSECLPAYR